MTFREDHAFAKPQAGNVAAQIGGGRESLFLTARSVLLRCRMHQDHLINSEIETAMESSVLCWLGSVSDDGAPNVSPKEAFTHDGQGRVLVANIASPNSVRNIRQHSQVCVSFVNVFVQKGYKIVGKARILRPGDSDFEAPHAKLMGMVGDSFRIASVIELTPTQVEPIVAPSYRRFPESTETDRIRESLSTYQVTRYQRLAELSG